MYFSCVEHTEWPYLVGRLQHLIGRGGGEHLRLARRVHPWAEATVQRLVTRAAPGAEPDVAFDRRVDAHDDRRVVDDPYPVAVCRFDSTQLVCHDRVGRVDQLLHGRLLALLGVVAATRLRLLERLIDLESLRRPAPRHQDVLWLPSTKPGEWVHPATHSPYGTPTTKAGVHVGPSKSGRRRDT